MITTPLKYGKKIIKITEREGKKRTKTAKINEMNETNKCTREDKGRKPGCGKSGEEQVSTPPDKGDTLQLHSSYTPNFMYIIRHFMWFVISRLKYEFNDHCDLCGMFLGTRPVIIHRVSTIRDMAVGAARGAEQRDEVC